MTRIQIGHRAKLYQFGGWGRKSVKEQQTFTDAKINKIKLKVKLLKKESVELFEHFLRDPGDFVAMIISHF